MLANLIKLYKFLNKSNFNSEAKLVVDMLKTSAPIVEDGIVRINEESASTVRPGVERRKMYHSPGKDGVSNYYVEDWYSSVENLGDSIILIVFRENDVGPNFYRKIISLFKGSRYNFKNGEPDYGQTSRLIGSFGEDAASIESFLNTFPSVRTLFENMPAVKKKREEIILEEGEDFDEDMLYENFLIILMGEESYSSGGLATIYKSPYYLAHDLGHTSIDFSESLDLRSELEGLIHYLYSLYSKEEVVSEDEEEIFEEESEESSNMLYDTKDFDSQDEYELWHSGIPKFFNTTNSNYNDTYPDIFAELTETGTLDYNIPKIIDGDKHSWIISDENISLAHEAVRSFIESQSESISEGVLSDHYGSVMFM